MRKYSTPLFLYMAVLVACLASCGDKGSQIDFDTVNVERKVALTKDADSPQCSVKMSIAYAKDSNGKVAKTINNAIQQKLFYAQGMTVKQAAEMFADKYTAEYVKSLAPLYREDRADTAKHAWYRYTYNVNTETRQGRDGVTLYIINLDYYEGGAHGVSQQTTINFDTKTGKAMTLADVFVPGYKARLNEALLKALEDKVGAKDVKELHDNDYLYSMDMFAPENFLLGDDGITFIYNIYEIAPYSKGKTELTLDYSDINDLLKK